VDFQGIEGAQAEVRQAEDQRRGKVPRHETARPSGGAARATGRVGEIRDDICFAAEVWGVEVLFSLEGVDEIRTICRIESE
jgi:hypothetical protein